jgi:hypothetical protein
MTCSKEKVVLCIEEQGLLSTLSKYRNSYEVSSMNKQGFGHGTRSLLGKSLLCYNYRHRYFLAFACCLLMHVNLYQFLRKNFFVPQQIHGVTAYEELSKTGKDGQRSLSEICQRVFCHRWFL